MKRILIAIAFVFGTAAFTSCSNGGNVKNYSINYKDIPSDMKDISSAD